MQSRITKLAAAAVLALAVLLLARHLTGGETPAAPANESSHIAQVPDNQEAAVPVLSGQGQKLTQLARELDSARELFTAADAKGLLKLLDTGLDQTKITVAGYLGQMKEESAVPALQWLADRWQGPPDDNPFHKSIEQIRSASSPREETDKESRTQGRASTTAEQDRRITIQVSDKATGAPIVNAAIETFTFRADPPGGKHSTDANGMFVLDMADSTPEWVRAIVLAADYVGQVVELRDFSDQSLPRTIHFALEKGITIGGIVQDNAGRPVKGATVEGIVSNETETQFEQPRVYLRIKETTDDQGRWRANRVPAWTDSNLLFRVVHPEFAGGAYRRDDRFEDLRAERAVMVLKEGLTVTGRVVDEKGVAIEGAELRAGGFDREAKTDAAGSFQLSRVETLNATFVLTVQARGYTPQCRGLAAREDLPPIEFVLKPARTFRGRVVDAAGQPVEKALVQVIGRDNWSGLKWSDWTDAKGTFLWDYPPDDSVLLYIDKEGYTTLSQDVTANNQAQTFVLSKPMVIRGTVTDAQTKEPVKRFRLGSAFGQRDSDSVEWAVWQPTATWFTNGRYSYAFPHGRRSYAIRIEADGYLPAESAPVEANEQGATIDFVLTKGDGPSGYVFDANSRPAGGVQVVWARKVMMQGGRADVSQRMHTKTDENGHFVFPAGSCREPLLAIGDQGIGGVSYEELAANGFITLKPWARVEGQWWIGSQPAAKKELPLASVIPGDFEHDWDEFGTVMTDENGRFVFERVCPGEFRLKDDVFTVLPGQILELKLGGTGRTVKGELALADAPETPIRVGLTLVMANKPVPFDKIPKPPGYEQMTLEEVRAWLAEFNESPEGKAYADWVDKNYPQSDKRVYVPMDDRSRFHVDNIEPGAYILQGEVTSGGFYNGGMMGVSPGQEHLLSNPQGSVWHEFEVPPLASAGEVDIALDLGTLSLRPSRAKPGAPAPDFDVPSFGPDRVRLADYRGKLVVLTFVMEDCFSRYPQGLEELKALHQRFRENLRYGQISLLFETHPLRGKKAVDEAGLTWPHGWLAGRGGKELREYGGFQKVLWNILISPQGRIIAMDLSGEELEQAVEYVLQPTR